MRVLVLGSVPGHVAGAGQPVLPGHQPLFDAGRAIGWALARDNCRAIIGSSSERTIDPHIFAGYVDYCTEHPDVQRHIEIQFPADDDISRYESDAAGIPSNLHVVRIENYAVPGSPHRWIVSHFSALRSADLLLTLGGGASTRLLGSYAASSRIPVLAVKEYQGASAEVFLLARHTYREAVPRMGDKPTREAAQRVVQFGRQLVESQAHAVHSYFLSYSWSDCAAADCLEVLLRRFGRLVFRDEDQVRLGRKLPNQLEASIQEADTFVALWSGHYGSSTWCPSELEFAIESRASSGRPARIVLVELDDTKAPLRATDLLRAGGRSRDELHLCVRRLIEQE